MTRKARIPDSLECCFRALAEAVFSEEGSVCFHRTFVDFGESDRTRVLIRYANQAVEEGGTVAAAAKAVMIYPAIKWLLKAEKIEAVLAALTPEAECGAFGRLVGMQSMLVRMNGEKPELRLQMRQCFFERCRALADTVFSAVTQSVYRKATRKSVMRPQLAMLLLGEDDGVSGKGAISAHGIKTYYMEIIRAVAEQSGEEIRALMKELMPDTGPKTAELAVLYHNTELLLREYARIVSGYHDDGEMLLASMGSGESRYTERKCEQSVLLAEYIKLIRGAVEMTADFPGDRGETHKVLNALVSDDGVQKTDAELAQDIFLSTSAFSREKHRALTILGAVLWGCDANVLLDMLA